MSVQRRVIVAPHDRERTAVVLIPLPAGGEVEIDRTWRFVGWRDDVKVKVKREPKRLEIFDDDDV